MINGRRVAALCISRLGDNTCFDLVSSLQKTLVEHDCSLFIYNINSDLYNKEEETAEVYVYELIDYSVIDAIIIDPERIKSDEMVDKIINKAHENNVPVIIVEGVIEGLINVNFDFRGGFEKVVRHVVEFHGKNKIHYMAGHNGNAYSEERYETIKKVMDEHGLQFDRGDVSYGDFWGTPTQQATQRLVDSGNIPEAIICANDVMAINVCEVLQKNGYKVPGDIIVTGFDGINDIYFSNPKITSCICSYAEMGKRVAEIIYDMFSGKDIGEHYFIEPSMIISGSCGCHDNESFNTPNVLYEFNSRIEHFIENDRALSRRSEKIQNSRTLEEAAGYFDSYVFFDMAIFLNKRYTVPSIEPLNVKFDKAFEDKVCLLHYYNDAPINGPFEFERKNIVPNVEAWMSMKRPFVFNVIEYMNVPIGYALFNYGIESIEAFSMISMIVTALNNGLGGFLNIQKQKYLTQRIKEIYRTDSLTGLLNRMAFSKEFERLISKGVSGNVSVTVVLADLDDLKGINDNYGHIYGDKAIKAVATALSEACPDYSLVVRLGGDEMMAVIPGVESSIKIKQAIDTYLEEFSETLDRDIIVSASVGIYITSDPEEMTPDILIKLADKLMYEEKRKKKLLRYRG